MASNTDRVRRQVEESGIERAVVIERDTSVVVAAGENIGRADIEAQTTLYGTFGTSRGTVDSLLGEMDWPASITWSASVDGNHHDAEYPFDTHIRGVICNTGFRAQQANGASASRPEDIEEIYMYHLDVDEAARRMGYGQLMWDCYLATVAFGGLRAAGGVGSTEGAGTVRFLERQGVPADDVSPGSKAGPDGEGLTRWSTSARNVVNAAPVTVID